MQLVGENDSSINHKRPAFATNPRGVAQQVNMRDQQVRPVVLQTNSKEIGATGHAKATIVGHYGSVALQG